MKLPFSGLAGQSDHRSAIMHLSDFGSFGAGRGINIYIYKHIVKTQIHKTNIKTKVELEK